MSSPRLHSCTAAVEAEKLACESREPLLLLLLPVVPCPAECYAMSASPLIDLGCPTDRPDAPHLCQDTGHCKHGPAGVHALRLGEPLQALWVAAQAPADTCMTHTHTQVDTQVSVTESIG